MPLKGGSGGGGGKDVRAGGAFVEIFGRDKLTAMLAKMQARLVQFGKFLSNVGTMALKAGAALSAPLALLFAGGLNRAAEVDKLAESFGMSAEQMSRLAYAAEVAGVAIEDVIANQQKYASLIDSAPIIDADTARAATIAQREFRGALIALQGALVPLMKPFTAIISAIGRFARDNSNVMQIVAAVAGGLLVFGVAAKVAAIGVFGLSAAFGAAAIAVKVFGAILGAVVSPIGLVAVALAGLGYLFVRHTETGREFAETVGGALGKLATFASSVFRDMGQAFGLMFGGILDALRGGDLELAGNIALQGLRTIWARTVLALTEIWVKFKAVFVDTWHTMAAGGKLAWEQTTTAVAQGIVRIAEFMVVTFLSAIEKLTGAAADLADTVGITGLGDALRNVSGGFRAEREGAQALASETRKNLAEDLKGREKNIMKELTSRLDANRKAGADQIANARKGYEEALIGLQSLRQQAANIGIGAVGGERRGLIPESVFIQKDALAAEARGGFASRASGGQFGFGGVADGRADLKTLAKNSAEWVKATALLNIIAKRAENLGIVVGN